MNPPVIDIVVEVLDKRFSLEEVTLDVFPPELFKWELGGLTDPIGQLFTWLWNSIQSTFSIVRIALEGALWTVRDYLYSAFQLIASGISSAITSVASTLSSVYEVIQTIPNTLSSLFGPISSAISTIGSGITAFGSVLSSIWGSLQGIGSQILGGISGFFSTIQSWLSSAIASVSTSISSLASTFTSYMSQIATGLGNIGSAISGVVSSIVSSVSNAIQSVGQSISSSISGVTTYLTNIGQSLASSFAGITNFLSTFGTAISSAFSGLQGFFSNIAQTLGSALSGVSNFLSTFSTQLWNSILGLRDSLINSFKTISVNLTQLWDGIQTWVGDIPKFFEQTWTQVTIGLTQFGKTITGFWQNVQSFFTNAYNSLTTGVREVMTTLGGFVNPLIQIAQNVPTFVQNAVKFFGDLPKVMDGMWKWLTEDLPKWLTEDVPKWFENIGKGTEEWLKGLDVGWLNKVFEGIAGFIKDPLGSIGNVFKGIVDWGQSTLFPAIKGGLTQIGEFLTDIGKTLWNTVTGFFKTGFEWIATGVKDLLTFFTPKSPSILDDLAKFFADLLGAIFFKPFAMIPTKVFERTQAKDLPKETPMESTIAYMGGLMLEAVAFPYMLSSIMKTVGDNVPITFEGGMPKLTVKTEIKPALLFKHLAKVIWKLPDVFLGSLGYGFGIWMTQPILRVVNSFKRNEMPIEMPNLQEIREMANRASVLAGFEEIWGELTQFMAYYGYSDRNVTWNLGFFHDVTGLTLVDPSVSVKDRFGNDVEIPLALRHRLPSGSEFATMMVRDIFATFEDFSTTMKVQGYGEDVSKLYYLQHYKYPPMDSLWKFIARMAAGFGWAEGAIEKPAGLGFDAATPKALSAKYSGDPIKGLVALSKSILPYAKWHDYAPFGWINPSEGDFSTDRLIMLDLMARLPDRIEGRWMYKWSIIDDVALQRLVVAEGFHPNVIENVSIAEAMNALTEERSSARTGIMNTFEAGFMSKSQVEARLGQITTISILGKERVVKLLDGEKKLEVIRSLYDRSKNILSHLWSNVISGFSRNMLEDKEAMSIVTEIVGKVKTNLGLDLTVDEAFLSIWLESYQVRRYTDTVTRIRSLMRVFIYRASQLSEAGENVETLIDQFCMVAKLTPTEAEIMKSLATAFVRASRSGKRLTVIKQSVSGRLKRGEISTAQAITELVNAGLPEDEAKAWLEANARFRTVSTDKLVSMAEYVPIDAKLLREKMDSEGVPLNEQGLYQAYAVATEVAEEMGKIVTQLVDNCVDGLFDENVLAQKLDDLATLSGTVKQQLGVDWIVISPQERTILVNLAKIRKAALQSPTTKMKTLSSDKLITMSENVPIDPVKLVEKMNLEGIPADEQKLMIPFQLGKEISAEMGRIVTELLTDHANGVLSIKDFNSAIDDLATLGGAVPTLLGVPWIVLSPLERAMFTNLAKLRRMRVLAKAAGVK